MPSFCDYQQAQVTARHLPATPHGGKWMNAVEYSATRLGTPSTVLSKAANVSEGKIQLGEELPSL